jgi:dihydroorotase
MYDLIIRGGTVIDCASGVLEKRDIFIKDGRIAAGGEGESEKVIRADGCYVTPGLIDSHIHLFRTGSNLGGRADLVCPSGGVTCAIDAGSAGLYNFDSFYNTDIRHSATTVKATLSTTTHGVQMPPYEEIQDPDFATPERVRPVFERYPDTLVGIKQRVHKEVTGPFGLHSLEQALKTAAQLRSEGYRCRLMVHFGDLGEGISVANVLELLAPGDVFTHIYRPANGTTIFGPDGRVLDCVKQARRRGVIFESGCARSHLSFASIQRAFDDGFAPQIISTDMIGKTFFWKPSGWLPLKMSIYLDYGMPLEEVVRAVTATPAQVYGLEKEAGSLAVGMPADVAVFRVEERPCPLEDLYGGSRTLRRLIVPMATVKGGAPVFEQIFLP